MSTDENFTFAESALQAGPTDAPAPPASTARAKRVKFSLSERDGAAAAPVSGFDPYNATGGFDRKQAWDRVSRR